MVVPSRLRQEDGKFKASLSNFETLSPKGWSVAWCSLFNPQYSPKNKQKSRSQNLTILRLGIQLSGRALA